MCKLHKSIYGLGKVSRQWYSKISQSLIEFDFLQMKLDYLLFLKGSANKIVLLIYVDDIMISNSSFFDIYVVKMFFEC